MTVLDMSVPTGFAAVEESLAALLDNPNIKRYDVAGRKVIVYIEDMDPGDTGELHLPGAGPLSGARQGSRVDGLLLLHPAMER